jgi:hypothetical protein
MQMQCAFLSETCINKILKDGKTSSSLAMAAGRQRWSRVQAPLGCSPAEAREAQQRRGVVAVVRHTEVPGCIGDEEERVYRGLDCSAVVL